MIAQFIFKNSSNFDDLESALRDATLQYEGGSCRRTRVDTSEEVKNMFDFVYGHDIIFAFDEGDALPSLEMLIWDKLNIDRLNDAVYKDISINNPCTLVKILFKIPEGYDMNIIKGYCISIIDMIGDNMDLFNKFRWVRDDHGIWMPASFTYTENLVSESYANLPRKSERSIAHLCYNYKATSGTVKGSKRTGVPYRFRRDGYLVQEPGFHRCGKMDKHMYVKEDLSLAKGWTLINGKWHLFNNKAKSEYATCIDGEIYTLKNEVGLLDEDASKFYVDPDDMYRLHKV